MNRESEEYKQYRKEYDERQEARRNDPDNYPYFVYFQFGFHHMTYYSEKEVKQAVRFYHLHSDGNGGYERIGRYPIFIIPRKRNNKC